MQQSSPNAPARRGRSLLAVALAPCLLASQGAPSLPFAYGERLSYAVHAGPGMNGRAEMWIAGPADVRGVATMVLHSEVTGGFGPFKVSDKSTSWIDPDRMATLRFTKSERNPLGRHEEDVAIDGDAHTWRATDGRSGVTLSAQPLDELSFIYALRTLHLPGDSALVLNRHFDRDRNPTAVRLLGRAQVTTPAGTFATREIEMRVRDTRRYRGEGVIRISLSDDACRRPVRIESAIPNAGTVTMQLTAAEPEFPACAGH
ncbi:MAG: DUF3108 domain-containing protein [bacterium]